MIPGSFYFFLEMSSLDRFLDRVVPCSRHSPFCDTQENMQFGHIPAPTHRCIQGVCVCVGENSLSSSQVMNYGYTSIHVMA